MQATVSDISEHHVHGLPEIDARKQNAPAPALAFMFAGSRLRFGWGRSLGVFAQFAGGDADITLRQRAVEVH